MSFKISVIDRVPRKWYGVLSVKGSIEIGDLKESLYMPLDWWSIDDYEKQWKEGIGRLKDHNTSALVVTIHNPHKRRFVTWWLLYREGDLVYVHNQMLFSEIYAEQIGDNAFTIDNCYEFISPRHSFSEDGTKISEWVVDLKDIIGE